MGEQRHPSGGGEPVRQMLVDELTRAMTGQGTGTEHVAELIANATPRERAEVAARHGRLAELHAWHAHQMAQAIKLLMPFWRGAGQSLGDVLKVAPADVVAEAVEHLRNAGFGEDDGLPPVPGEGGG